MARLSIARFWDGGVRQDIAPQKPATLDEIPLQSDIRPCSRRRPRTATRIGEVQNAESRRWRWRCTSPQCVKICGPTSSANAQKKVRNSVLFAHCAPGKFLSSLGKPRCPESKLPKSDSRIQYIRLSPLVEAIAHSHSFLRFQVAERLTRST